MYLLDTNIVSELRKCSTEKGNAGVCQWAATVNTNELYISAITLLEIEMGILMVERKEPQQGEALRAWMNQRVLPAFEDRVLALDTPIALECAKLHVPNPKSERDAMIAATAIIHKMIVVTRNIKDFEKTSAKLFNPWS
ncbi:twitching motility protein PilT [Endozoicomonas sp. (ex Bugula neritina AB1)]|nr:twitching motility protein PilT [Endozoicomonas sp. (ex Bugula neritina AB1)]